ncbi:MAG: hypothetical protein V3R64_02440 [Sphingomonadales bacterium]
MKANPIWILGGLILIFALGACGPKRQRIGDPPPELTPEMREQLQQRLNSYDLNQDGIVSCEDVAIRRTELFTIVDEDKSGGLDQREYMELRWHDKLYVLLELSNDDRDHNGQISLEEFQERSDPYFRRLDKDRDCIITVEEYQVELLTTQQQSFRPGNTGQRREKRRR